MCVRERLHDLMITVIAVAMFLALAAIAATEAHDDPASQQHRAATSRTVEEQAEAARRLRQLTTEMHIYPFNR